MPWQKKDMHDTARLDDKVNTKSGEKVEKRFLQAIPHPGGGGGGGGTQGKFW